MPNKGDVAWMLVCTALVIMMSIPALALFYGGLVRSKNMLSVLMQVFVTFSMIVVLWCLYGYSLAFTEGNAFFGGFDRALHEGHVRPDRPARSRWPATFSKGVVIPELLFMAFQATFAAITCCLIVGAFAERMKFSAVLAFMVLWFTFAYAPIAHMVSATARSSSRPWSRSSASEPARPARTRSEPHKNNTMNKFLLAFLFGLLMFVAGGGAFAQAASDAASAAPTAAPAAVASAPGRRRCGVRRGFGGSRPRCPTRATSPGCSSAPRSSS